MVRFVPASDVSDRSVRAWLAIPHARVLLILLVALAGVAWLALILGTSGMSSAMMVAMVTGGGIPGFAFFLAVWVAMMVAMMFPAAAPMVRAYVTLNGAVDPRKWKSPSTVVFVGAYLALWAAFGILVGLTYLLLAPRYPTLRTAGAVGRTLAGGLFLAAGIYQWTPLKSVCLRSCQTPLGFVLRHWRSGLRGAGSMGVRHATYCLGCCWLLFGLFFGVGIMAVPWMALLAVVIFVEKWLNPSSRIPAGIGAAFVAIGATVLLAPAGWLGWLGIS